MIYHKEFDEALEEYNKKQTRPDRRIEEYFEHVAGKEQDMAVEIIIQIGDREFWKGCTIYKNWYTTRNTKIWNSNESWGFKRI